MRQVSRLFLVGIVLCLSLSALGQGGQAAANVDVYHVHFTKAALGKSAELGKVLSTPDPKAPMPGHFIVLRHQEGDEWDYCVIEHLGTKYTVDAAPSATPPAQRDLSAWHGDTFVSGPSWAEFTKAIGIGDPKMANAVYTVGTFRAAAGHRDQLKALLTAPSTSKIPTGTVYMEHLEGGPWNFLVITRYSSWQDMGADRTGPGSDAGWNETRDHVATHHDTIADRIYPK